MRFRAIGIGAIVVLLMLCLGGVALLQAVGFVTDSIETTPRDQGRASIDDPDVAALFPTPESRATFDAISVVQEAGPAVVTVINQQRARGGLMLEAGVGTGFIVSEQGYIVTNQHVVDGGMSFEVVLADGTKREARLVGEDKLSDLAVLQIEGPVPGTVPLGDSGALQPGQRVLAIGSALGSFTNTVTRGIVSAVDRDFPGAGTYTNLVQHDAAINRGNSGGPLLNLAGEVVGVNALGVQRNAYGAPVQGLFFAVPSNQVREVAAELITNGRVVYPYLGVAYTPVTAHAIAQLNLHVESGVILTGTERGGPADRAGLRQYDVILAVDGQPVDAENTFIEVLSKFSPGETVTIT
ncbi:MAG TPA: trypsin-like peptidase domain-containing protein, partial [Thermomicrobiales bacterium]|nr:trypsin-like peptidase domain-containing protein [Thermomicrobiales bacterium]